MGIAIRVLGPAFILRVVVRESAASLYVSANTASAHLPDWKLSRGTTMMFFALSTPVTPKPSSPTRSLAANDQQETLQYCFPYQFHG
ncbi:hypothetical protein CEXT_649171 [Caerostris extrusa]|uniref:Secreted protein n=1 Tax=Caerostris extrusa TaxID=172846 RepID=A0AAV4NRH8_CAEEX|nr:hypothetical protein CEXT_649171 [Caerostris extrusa]